jgi:esterase/lipase
MRQRFVVLALLVLGAAGAVWAAPAPGSTERAVAQPRLKPLPLREKCLRRTERLRVVRFRAADGIRLLGVTFGRGRSGVVLAHGLRNDFCSWVPYARTLAARGYRVLAFDFRGHGSSATQRGTNTWRNDLDVVGAVRELRRRGVASVVLAGSSLGGTAALTAAATISPPVQGVISLSAPRSWVLMDAENAVRRMQVPVLFLAAELDDPLQDDARALYEASASGDRRLEILPGSGAHGTRLLPHPPMRAAIEGFLAGHSSR